MLMFEIPLRLPGINEYQAACRRHPLNGAQMKKNAIRSVMPYLTPVRELKWPVQVEIYYTEPNKRRDIDNITGFGAKVILDALVKCGFLPDDGPSYINKIDQGVNYEQGNANILVMLKEPGDPTYVQMATIDDAFLAAQRFFDENPSTTPVEEKPLPVVKKPKETRARDSRSKKDTQTLTMEF